MLTVNAIIAQTFAFKLMDAGTASDLQKLLLQKFKTL